MKKKLISIMIAAMLVLSSAAATAVAATPSPADASVMQVEMTVGKPEVTVNGEVLTVKSPVVVGGSTLVPLRVITTAFDASLQWIAETQGIVLTYGDQTIELQIGNNASTVNGEHKDIPGAPLLVEGTTMVPIRFISEAFGASVHYEEKTQTIVIKGEVKHGSYVTEIDGDQGKTKIGDSHWGWTMNYPSGLVQDYQSFSGDWIYFTDANGEYMIDITVDATKPQIKKSGLLNELSEYVYDGTILEKRLVEEEGTVYAKILSKNSYGSYIEDRAYLQDSIIYFFSFEIFNEADFKNQGKYAVYESLIDSFDLSFDKQDSTVKDVSSVKDGFIQHEDEVYGISVELPADWTNTKDTSSLTFYSVQNDFSLNFTMSSLEDGETVESWAQRHENRFKEELLPSYREIITFPNRTVAGAPALIRLWSEAIGEGWTDTYDVYVIKGEYKYNFSFFYDKTNRDAYRPTIERIVNSIQVDESVASESFGYLADEYGIDLGETVEIVNGKYGYTVTLPSYWSKYMDNEDVLFYDYQGGSFEITADESTTLEEEVEMMEGILSFFKEMDSSAKVESLTVSFKGEQAKKIVVEENGGTGSELRTTTYIFEKNGTVFTVETEEYRSAMTPENNQRMAAALESLTFE